MTESNTIPDEVAGRGPDPFQLPEGMFFGHGEETAGIVCPGPSLRDPKTQRLILQDQPRTLWAVNGAILAPLFPFHEWVVSDEEVFGHCINQGIYIRPDVTLWHPARWDVGLAGRHELNIPFSQWYNRLAFYPDSNASFCAWAGLKAFPEEINWRESTFLISIGLAIGTGARRIYLYGADMSGRGYFRKGLENSRTIHTEARWEQERLQLAMITTAALDQGITIVHRR
ncbi:MAG: hypothetical protein WC478_05640 [Candidatus Omnitrophota bacterium]